MFCNHCGKRNPDGANYCFGCGAALDVAIVPVISSSRAVMTARVREDVDAISAQTVDSFHGKQCPICGLYNPGISGRCDCGYSFVTAQPSLARPHYSRSQLTSSSSFLSAPSAFTSCTGVIRIGDVCENLMSA